MLHDRARATGCLLDHRVTTFPELTDALARDLGVTARVLEPELAAVVLAHALERPGTPDAFRAPRRGLLHELLRVLDELKAAYLGPDDVAAIAAAMPSEAAGTRLADIARVYAAYEAGLARVGAVDRHGREWRVCEALAAATTPRPLRTLAGVCRVVFAEIYDFSVLQFLIATSLIRIVGDAELVAFAHPENVDATRFLDRTWNRFVADPAIADQVLPSFVVRGGRTGNLAAALRGLFAAERAAPAAADGSIRVLVAPSRYREVEAAVRDIRLRLERGERPERLALVTRDLAVYGELIEDVCRRYRVPVYFRKGKPLVANGLVKACLTVVRCVVEGFPRARLEGVLDADCFPAAPPVLVRTLRRVGFVAETARPLAECVAHHLAGLPPERRDAVATAAAKLVDVVAALRSLDVPRSVTAHARGLIRVLRRLGLRPLPRSDALPAAIRRDARAWERFEETLVALGAVTRALGVGAVPLGEFLRLLLATLESLEVEDPAERSGTVRALSVLDARGLDFDAVWLLGLDDGTFPAPRAESPLWSDAMKREANRTASALLARKLGPRADGLPLGGLLRTAREASLEDPFLFFLALSMAEREIVLSYPAVNEQGNPTVPSPFLDELAAVVDVPRTELDPTALVPLGDACCEPAELVGRAALDRWARRRDASPDRLTTALAAAHPALGARIASIDRRAAIEERRSRYFLSPRGDPLKTALADAFVGRLSGDVAPLAARIDAMAWSPSRLEALGACRFKFYARHVLGLREADDPEAAVDPAERGTLVHAVLERLFAEQPELPRDLAVARQLVRDAVTRAREAVVGRIAAKDPALLDVAWQQVAAAVDRLVTVEHREQTARWAEGIRVEYRLEESVARTLADGDGGSILLMGTPDRVEVHRRDGRAVGLRVLDYKMSRAREDFTPLIDPARELGKTGFQIPVYLLGALGGVGDLAADASLAGGYLVLLADKMEVVRAFTPDDLDAVSRRIAALVAEARAGRFDVDPDPCDIHCPYRAVCRYQRPPLEEELGVG